MPHDSLEPLAAHLDHQELKQYSINRAKEFLEAVMRYIFLACFYFLFSSQMANSHPESDNKWAFLEYDGEALINCSADLEAGNCQSRLYPCESAFKVSVDADLAVLSQEIRHDLTACFMELFDLYEVALWKIAPGAETDPVVARKANSMFSTSMFRHHRNAPGECRSDQYEKTEDWRCASQALLNRLIKAEKDAR